MGYRRMRRAAPARRRFSGVRGNTRCLDRIARQQPSQRPTRSSAPSCSNRPCWTRSTPDPRAGRRPRRRDLETLTALGEHLGADRASVLQNDPSQQVLVRTHQWVREGMSGPPVIEPRDAFPWLLAQVLEVREYRRLHAARRAATRGHARSGRPEAEWRRLGRVCADGSRRPRSRRAPVRDEVLERCRWTIEGRGQAAERLGLSPSTLRNRMRKLGIKRPPR